MDAIAKEASEAMYANETAVGSDCGAAPVMQKQVSKLKAGSKRKTPPEPDVKTTASSSEPPDAPLKSTEPESKKPRKYYYDSEGNRFPDTTDEDIARLAASNELVKEQKSGANPLQAVLIPDDSSQLRDEHINAGLVTAVKRCVKLSLPGKMPRDQVDIRFDYPQPTPSAITTLRRRLQSESKHQSATATASASQPRPTYIDFLPVNISLGGGDKFNHWVMVIVDRPRKLVTYWDPLGWDDASDHTAVATSALPQSLINQLLELFGNGGWTIHFCPDRTQGDTFQCGAWVIFGFARYYSDMFVKDAVSRDAVFELAKSYRFAPTRRTPWFHNPFEVIPPFTTLDDNLHNAAYRKAIVKAYHDNKTWISEYRRQLRDEMLAGVDSKTITLADLIFS